MRNIKILPLLIIGEGLLLHSTNASAGSFEVAPTTIFMSARSRSGILYITNRGSQAVMVQVEAFDWQQPDMKDKLERTDKLMISPPMAHLMPGQKQTVRLAVKPGDDSNERAFRIKVSELPNPEFDSSENLQVLLQFSIPVFVGAKTRTPTRLDWSVDGGSSLLVRNNGTRHVKILGITANFGDGGTADISKKNFNYILAGASHKWDAALPSSARGETIKLKMLDENEGELTATISPH